VAKQPHPVQAWRRRCAHTRGVGQALLGLVLALGEYMDGGGRCGVSNARLAEDCEVSVRTIQRQLHQLHGLGLLGIDQAPGGHAVNRYQARPWDDTAVTPGRDTRVTPGSLEGRHPWRDPVTPVSPEVEGQKTIAGAPARAQAAPPGWVPEDDAEIAAIQAQRERDAEAAKVKSSSEGWGSEEARERAAEALSFAEQLGLGFKRKAEP